MNLADLHCHTRFSDGSFSVDELIPVARRASLSALAVTDHDTYRAVRAVAELSPSDLTVIGGLELSVCDKNTGRNVHLLVYFPDLMPDNPLEQLCLAISHRRNEAGKEMLERIAADYFIDPTRALSYAADSEALFKQHILRACMDAGYTDRIYGDLRKKLFSMDSLYRVQISYPTVEEGLAAIRAAHGVVVLAHPYEYDSIDLMVSLVSKKMIDGIEAFHPSATPEQRKQLASYAEENGLLVTGGSDFHGMYNSRVPCPLGTCTVPASTAEDILQRKN